MPDVIRLLPDGLASQIAAGEVVQRPASVVKELLENSVDAGATHIQLLVKEAGKVLIQVTDNGCGMSPTDARMCFERHATSKIRQVEDLFNIRTFGFRGEAMASIAAVAQVELKTRRQEDTLGTRVVIEGAKVVLQEPCPCPKGTQVSVKNLFFNVPARRNFLKSNSVEWKHILEEFTRMALAQPEIAFVLYHNDAEIFNLKPSNLAQRIVALFGKSYKENLLPCKEELSDKSLFGYIGKPEAARKARGEQFFFVNNRFIKHSYLHHAVMTAFERLIPEGSYPFYVIKLTANPNTIDVNIHPTKTEVKFEDERAMYALVQSAVRQALGVHHLSPTIDFQLDANFDQPKQFSAEPDSLPLSFEEYQLMRSHTRSQQLKSSWETLYPPPKRTSKIHSIGQGDSSFFSQSSASSDFTQEEQTALFTSEETSLPLPKLMLLHGQYILSQVKSGLMVLDIRAAYERIFYEQHLQQTSATDATQLLLFPEEIHFAADQLAQLIAFAEELKQIGFRIELKDANQLVCTAVPAGVEPLSVGQVLAELIEQAAHFTNQLKLSQKETLAAVLAKRRAQTAPLPCEQEVMQDLINRLFACQQPNYTPEGRKIIAIINLDTLESLFV
ncbi:MAG: DNA mismatch repair endonuclease MutL [Cytophagales bacterium]|nr:DNA mismatch repair endonuclease MutL [Bernardetiaceae bacterium]MDW8209498.1 DNA mismatch repair endonuclease MutL [Cytophagales bacterium]